MTTRMVFLFSKFFQLQHYFVVCLRNILDNRSQASQCQASRSQASQCQASRSQASQCQVNLRCSNLQVSSFLFNINFLSTLSLWPNLILICFVFVNLCARSTNAENQPCFMRAVTLIILVN